MTKIKAYHKKFFAVFLSALLLFSSCKNTDDVSYEKKAPEDEEIFSICILQSAEGEKYDLISKGYLDALYDFFGEDGVSIKKKIVSSDFNDYDLIFANGEDALSLSSEKETTIPIVGAGVMDFKRILKIHDPSWGGKTKTNVTGVSTRVPISSALSLMIEADHDLSAVGILYKSGDYDAIYQNEILEGYLDEAGIPWKEFLDPLEIIEKSKPKEDSLEEASEGISSDSLGDPEYASEDAPEDSADSNNSGEDQIDIVLPNIISAPSAKEGVTYDIRSIGESETITGLNADDVIRLPKTSKNWVLEDSDEAIFKCDTFFISSGSMLTAEFSDIKSLSLENHIKTIALDLSLAGDCLVCLYSDPYAEGYEAGRISINILKKNQKPGNIKINGAKSSDCFKLYNNSYREALELPEFPKSFREYREFMENYVPGETTEREAG